MDLAELRIFLAVVGEGGVTRAAKRLHRVQSNVTTRIRQLEDDLGANLFLREGKRMQLTPAGRTLLEYAEQILMLCERARDAVQDRAPRGVFRLGAMESTAAVRLPGPLAAYSRRYPDVRLELRTGNPTQLAIAILSDEIDAALVAEPVAAAQFDSMVAFREEPVIVAAKGTPKLGPKQVPKSIIVFEHGCPHRKRLEGWCEAAGALPERVIELGSYHAMLGCVLAGMGAALLPRSVLATFPESKRLQVLPLPRGQDRIATLLIWRKGVRSSKVSALAHILERNKPRVMRPEA
ncbi:MAG TPA: LysR substrate-binding domain-containing protein [Hyphomicrobiaceae bacterium]|jgi:DNA-binding transcriptional LysR family regulator|nr:LysR substrate-binding domain-containing protein [Hyphomicrobiaceae bacterium]